MPNMIASQAAREIGVSTRTLAEWADRGRIRHVRSAAGWRFYDADDVARLKRELKKRPLLPQARRQKLPQGGPR